MAHVWHMYLNDIWSWISQKSNRTDRRPWPVSCCLRFHLFSPTCNLKSKLCKDQRPLSFPSKNRCQTAIFWPICIHSELNSPQRSCLSDFYAKDKNNTLSKRRTICAEPKWLGRRRRKNGTKPVVFKRRFPPQIPLSVYYFSLLC